MTHWGATARLMSCASALALAGALAGAASAHNSDCVSITHPTTIATDKRCIRIVHTSVNGDVVNNAKIGKSSGDDDDQRAAVLIDDDGVITGKFVNNGKIFGGDEGFAALTLGEDADVQGGIFNNGTIVSKHESAIALGFYEHDGHDRHGDEDPQAAHLTGDIVNAGLIDGHDYGVAALYGTMSGTLINQADGKIVGGKAGVYIADSFAQWSGGIENRGVIQGGYAGIQIGDFGMSDSTGGEGDEERGSQSDADTENGTVFSGGIFNYQGGTIVGTRGPSIAIGGASFSGGVYNDGLITQALGDGSEGDEHIDEYVSLPYAGVGIVFAAPAVQGGLTNDVHGEIDGLLGPAVWITEKTQNFSDGISNNGKIFGADDAIRIESENFSGGLFNGGQGSIVASYGDGVFASSKWSGNFENHGLVAGTRDGFAYDGWSFEGSVLNSGTVTGGNIGISLDAVTFHGNVDNDGRVEGGSRSIAIEGCTFDGTVTNTGTIVGGATGVAIAVGNMTGGFTNSGSIDGETGNGVAIDAESWGSNDAPADIVNMQDGVITGGATGFLLKVGTMHGDFVNDGQISGYGSNTGVHIEADEFIGNFENNGELDAPSDALFLSANTFDGSIVNTGEMVGGETGAQLDLGQMTGGFSNSGTITGETGNGLAIEVSTWGSDEAPADILNTQDGVIEGGHNGISLDVVTFNGDFDNEGRIEGEYVAAAIYGGTFNGSITNGGTIQGGATGIALNVEDMTGGLTNSGSIGGETGTGIAIDAEYWGSSEAPADIVNSEDGVIKGGETGISVEVATFHGGFTNDGRIEGGNLGVLIEGETFDGAITNTGSIGGGATAVVVTLDQAAGGFTNNGSIDGASGNGVVIDVGIWGGEGSPADIVNEADGVIKGGETGFLLDVGTMYGDFVNDGRIAGYGENTGLHIIADEFFGDIRNDGSLDAPSNALHLEIGNLDGEVVNTGTITAGNANGIAVAIDIGNGTTFTNAGGGLVHGDVMFGGKASYVFVGKDGGIEGNLVGEGDDGNDDTIVVRDGTQYFVGSESGIATVLAAASTIGGGTASNFASFTVEDGGTAIMGAHYEGDPNGTGYAFNNVGALNVNSGGTLYIDKATTLNVDGNFVQQSGGTLEYFLGAPGGTGFANLTGVVDADSGDYGRIHVTGTAALNGAIVGFLDPAFASANPNLDQVRYNDVLVADGGIAGDFSTLGLISDSSLFQLDETVDGNTVDVQVTRTTLSNIGGVSGIVVNTGGPFDAMVSDRSNGIGSGSCGLAGPGWCFNKFASNEPGATQVMTDATPGDDPFAWLRTGVRRVGETSAWGRAVGVWGNTDGDVHSPGSHFKVAGAIAGVDHVFSPILMAGVAAQWTTTDIDFKSRPDKAGIDSFEAGAYVSYGDTRLYLNANASVIFHDIEVNRFAPAGKAVGKYDGVTLSGFAEAGKIFETEEGFRIQPYVALSYSRLSTDGYRENGAGALLNVSDSNFDSLKGMLGARLAYPIEMASGRKIVPEARIGWTHEFMDDQSSFTATIQGQPPVPSLIVGEKYARESLVVGGGVTVPISASTTFFVDYDASLNPDITTHTVSAGLRVTW